MFVRLKEKPFYFLTDRDTKYTFFIDNRQHKAQRYIYYPQQFQTMTSNQMRSYKWKLVSQLMWWSIFNKDKMTNTDYRICLSKVVDFGFTLVMGLICTKFFRRILFRIELPFFQMARQDSIFSSRWIKTVSAYTFAGIISYNSIAAIMKEQYLVDLALQYKYNFNKSLTCIQCDPILNELCKQRYEKIQQKSISNEFK